MGSIRIKFGSRVRELRAWRKMTQQELAETASMSLDFLSMIERGKRGPSIESIESLAKALGVPPFELFKWEEEEDEPSRL